MQPSRKQQVRNMSEYQEKLAFGCDYMRGAHPAVLRRLSETNMAASAGYGEDPYSEAAREKIRQACGCETARVEFLVGGTQANATVIDAFLRSWQGVIAAETGHIAVHEAGAVEAAGHKVLTLPQISGKLQAGTLREYLERFYGDATWPHMVQPGLVYISQPTELGTLYSLKELEKLRQVCDEYKLPLYADGARLAYALACPENDVSLQDMARLCDVFYIGGTKCGTLFGEAVVIRDPSKVPNFFTIVKQHGALLAKGRIAALQFDALFTDGLYFEIGRTAVDAADRIRDALKEKGYELCFGSPTNQLFFAIGKDRLPALEERVALSIWEEYDEDRYVIRLVTDWATGEEEIQELLRIL